MTEKYLILGKWNQIKKLFLGWVHVKLKIKQGENHKWDTFNVNKNGKLSKLKE
jgi:hypothetical protein